MAKFKQRGDMHYRRAPDAQGEENGVEYVLFHDVHRLAIRESEGASIPAFYDTSGHIITGVMMDRLTLADGEKLLAVLVDTQQQGPINLGALLRIF